MRDCCAVAAEGGRSCLKMWVAKTVHLLETVRNLDRYKRLIFASLMSTVLIISIVFLGSLLLTGQSVSSDSSRYLEIFVEEVEMWNLTMNGPRWYNITTDKGLFTLQVTNITMSKAAYSNMSLISCLDGRNLTMEVTSADATKVIVYTTYIGWAGTEIYGNQTVEIPAPSQPPPYYSLLNVRMKVVYMHTGNFSAPHGLNLMII